MVLRHLDGVMQARQSDALLYEFGHGLQPVADQDGMPRAAVHVQHDGARAFEDRLILRPPSGYHHRVRYPILSQKAG